MKNPFNIILLSLLLLFLLFTLGFASAPPREENLLLNGSFEDGVKDGIPLNWGKEYYNCFVEQDKNGNHYLRITNLKPQESLGAQTVPLDGEKIRRIFVSANVKGENIVPGKINWQKSNLQVLFFDGSGKQVGGWPELGPWTGTFGWTFVKKGFLVPREAKLVKIVLGLYQTVGSVSFDDVKLYVMEGAAEDPYNFILNGDFEIWETWAYGGTEGGGLYSPGYKSDSCLKISNPLPNWSFASQSVPLDGRRINKIKISGVLKIEGVVAGEKPWQKARINIEFKDASGKRIDGYPIVYEGAGTFDWQVVSNTFDVPPDTRRVDVFAGLLECSGTAYFDDLKMEGYDTQGAPVKKESDYRTDVSGWNKFDPPTETVFGTAADVSYLLDPPAGKHGLMKVKEGHFYFADGTRARFWGTNIYGTDCFPDHKTAEKMAERLAKFGCNLVRMHHMDAFWSDPNVFNKNYNDTLHLSEANLEKFDYLVWQMKKRGIYIFLDLLVDREFKEGDNVADWRNVERGAKFAGFFNRRIINLQKKYAHDILIHYNPYTKLKYVNDPAVCSVKLINEAMLYYIGTQVNLSAVYLAELDSLWNKWLIKKYATRDALKRAWTDRYGRVDLNDYEAPLKGNVARGKTTLKQYRSDYEKAQPMREADTMRFYYDLEVSYFKEMQAYLRGIGVKIPLSGSNHWVNIDADVKANASLDYIDRHRYWDHPQYGYGTQIVFNDNPMVKSPEESLPNNFAFYKVAGVPFVISEWNCCFPNEYRIEGPIIMASYACLQDWDAVLQFSFSGGEWGKSLYDNFDIGAWPNVFGQWPAAALMFYRRDVKAAKNVIEETVSNQEMFAAIDEDKPIAGEPLLPLISRTQRRYVENRGEMVDTDSDVTSAMKFNDGVKKVVSSDTGEIVWMYGDGVFKVDTGKTQGALGFFGGRTVSLSDLEVSSGAGFASIFLSSLDGVPVNRSSHLLLTVGARIENTGQIYNASRSQLKDVGSAPILYEGVSASLTMKTVRTGAIVYALDINGSRIKEVGSKIGSNGLAFDIRPDDKAFFYEIVIK